MRGWSNLKDDLLAPLRVPHHPLVTARFGVIGLLSALSVAQTHFVDDRARALFAGMAAHSMLPLERPLSAGFGLVLGASGHAVGWPMPRGGSQHIAEALASYLSFLGGKIETGRQVKRLGDLPNATVTLLDLTPRQIVKIVDQRLPDSFRRKLEDYRYGPGVFKMDWALSGPVPWTAAECERAGTLHLGGTMAEIAHAERAVWQGSHPDRPFVVFSQPSLFDPSRAPRGLHTAWAYCHVPNGSSFDMTDRIEDQVERFAPGFRERVLKRNSRSAVALEQYNPNYVGGDINGGVQDIGQLFSRPAKVRNPYSIPSSNIFICSSSTPPGGGVHGMCGYWAARAALRHLDH